MDVPYFSADPKYAGFEKGDEQSSEFNVNQRDILFYEVMSCPSLVWLVCLMPKGNDLVAEYYAWKVRIKLKRLQCRIEQGMRYGKDST